MTKFRYLCLLLLVLPVSCRMSKSLELQQAMIQNATRYDEYYDQLRMGEELPTNLFYVARVRILKWDDSIQVGDFIRQVRRPTFSDVDVAFPRLNVTLKPESYIKDLSNDEQRTLMNYWEECVCVTLTRKSMDTDKRALLNTVKSHEVRILYVLVGRDDSSEMGHKDVVMLIVVDPKQRILGKLRKDFVAVYPLEFVDQSKWTYDFLL